MVRPALRRCPKQAPRILRGLRGQPDHLEAPQPESLVRHRGPPKAAVARARRAEPVSRLQAPVEPPGRLTLAMIQPARVAIAGHRAAGAWPGAPMVVPAAPAIPGWAAGPPTRARPRIGRVQPP